ncbi:MAG: LacI family DNA-binding transcriptional regulator [Caldilineaceae bacterium]
MIVTIKDVAKHAGLSQATVSRALNKSGYVSEATLQRVMKAVADLDYQPNWMARGLHGKSSNLVGLIVPEVLSMYDNSVIQFIAEKLHAHQYGLLLCLNNENAELDLSYLQLLHEKRAAGVIYTHPLKGNNSNYLRKLAEEVPIVELNRRREKHFLDAVLADNTQGAYQITKYLLELGHQRIGLIMGESELTTGKNRLNGYYMALHEAGLTIEPELVQIGSFSRQHGEVAAEKLLTSKKPPTAILAGSNRILLGVVHILSQRKIRVPDDLSLASFNDSEWLAFWQPPITTVDIAVEEMAHLAVDLLLRRITAPDKKAKPREYLLSTSLIIRDSCRKV